MKIKVDAVGERNPVVFKVENKNTHIIIMRSLYPGLYYVIIESILSINCKIHLMSNFEIQKKYEGVPDIPF